MRQALLHLVAHPETAADPEQVSNLLAATIAWVGHHSGDWKTEGLTRIVETNAVSGARDAT